MKTNNLMKTSLFLAISFCTFTAAYADNPTRHIYNDSNQAQTVTFSPAQGDITFNSGCISQQGGTCVIAPHSAAEFVYVYSTFGRCVGYVHFAIDGNDYQYVDSGIQGQGSNFYELNKPTTGDIHFYQNSKMN